MKSTLRTLCVAALAGAMALAASAAQAVASTAQSAAHSVQSGVYAVAEAAHVMLFNFMAYSGLILGITVTKSDVFTGKFPVRNFPMHSGLLELAINVPLPAANPVANDLLALCKIPAGVQVVDWAITAGDADSNGTPTLDFTLGTLNAGLTDLATTWKTGIVVAKDGSLVRAADNVAIIEASTAERLVGLKFTTTAATYVAGKNVTLVLKLLG